MPPEEPVTRPALIEIPLASLGDPAVEADGDGSPPGAEDSLEEEVSSEGEPRTGLGFFYKVSQSLEQEGGDGIDRWPRSGDIWGGLRYSEVSRERVRGFPGG